MFNEHPNCFMGKSLTFLNVQWKFKLFHGQITWFPHCSMNIQIVWWENRLIPNMFNEHTNCFMDEPLDSMNIQIVPWKNHLISWEFNGIITVFREKQHPKSRLPGRSGDLVPTGAAPCCWVHLRWRGSTAVVEMCSLAICCRYGWLLVWHLYVFIYLCMCVYVWDQSIHVYLLAYFMYIYNPFPLIITNPHK